MDISKIKDMTEIINKANSNYRDLFSKVKIDHQPKTKRRTLHSQRNVLLTDYKIITSKLDLSAFTPAPEEVKNAYRRNRDIEA